MKSTFILLTINGFDQQKLIENGISNDQSAILRSIFVMCNNNIRPDGLPYRDTLEVDGIKYYEIPQEDIIAGVPILKIKSKRALYNYLKPLIDKNFILKYPIKTKFFIALNNLNKLRNDAWCIIFFLI